MNCIKEIINSLDKLSSIFIDESFLLSELLNLNMSKKHIFLLKRNFSANLNKNNLYLKIKKELGNLFYDFTNLDNKNIYEKYIPIGTIGHITSSNDLLSPFLSVVEGLITGNVNIIRPSNLTSEVLLKIFNELFNINKNIKKFLQIEIFSSSDEKKLKTVFSKCDVISIWGSNLTIEKVSKVLPNEIEIIKWGHKISFEYVTEKGKNKKILQEICKDVCINNQQSCSSPQIVYFETDSKEKLNLFAEELFEIMKNISHKFKLNSMEFDDICEITTQVELAKMYEIIGDKKILEGKNFRIIIDYKKELISSPLFRTIIVKMISRDEIIKIFSKRKKYLQTVGLSCEKEEFNELSENFFEAGILRIRPAGMMECSYIGEPHDGILTLQRYVKKVNIIKK